MSKYKGNLVSATQTVLSGTNYTGKANGKFSLTEQIQAKQSSLWAKGATNPTTPTIGTATANLGGASILFTPSTDIGAAGTLTYTAVSTPEGISATGTASPLNITGLTNGTYYTFKIKATNSLNLDSSFSGDSNSTGVSAPSAPTIGTASATTGGTASITFSAPSSTGGLAITSYTATSTPENITGTSTSSPVVVTGLTNGTSYTFKVKATNSYATGPESAASNSVVPTAYVGFLVGRGTTNLSVAALLANATVGTTITSATATGTDVKITSTGSTIFCHLGTSIAAYPFDKGALSIGAAYATNITGLTNFAYSKSASTMVINSTDSLIIVTHPASPYVSAYPWNDATGFGTKYSNPATLPNIDDTNYSNSPWFFASESRIEVGKGYYSWSSGWGTYTADTLVNYSNYKNANAVFNNSNNIAYSASVTAASSGNISARTWTGSAWGTWVAGQSTGTWSPNTIANLNLNSTGTYLAANTPSTAANLATRIFPVSGTTIGTVISATTAASPGIPQSSEFILNNTFLASGTGNIYPFSSGTVGTAISSGITGFIDFYKV